MSLFYPIHDILIYPLIPTKKSFYLETTSAPENVYQFY